ncbi:MAG: hypothetical protein AAGJ50_10825, partial [Pseudomonadota bacterium]
MELKSIHRCLMAAMLGFLISASAIAQTNETPSRDLTVPNVEVLEQTAPASRINRRVISPNLGRAVPSRNRGLTLATPPPPPDRDIARSVAGSNAVWADTDILVCWEDDNPANADGRAWTRSAVEGSWAQVSNLNFIGWGKCEANSKGIRIRVAEAGPNVTELGRGLDGLPGGMTLNFTFAAWGTGCAQHREYCIRALAVHEFGHAIGMTHEHNRDDREVCQAEIQGPLPAFFMTDYDPTSVMNYCSPDWNNSGKLSPLDVAGARMLYGPFNAETPATVEIVPSVMFGDGETANEQPPLLFAVTDDMGSDTKTLWFCNSTQDELIELVATVSVTPGTHKVKVTNRSNLYDADACDRGERKRRGTSDLTLTEPLAVGLFANADLSGDGETAEASLVVRRTVGEERVVEDCQTCVAASAEAVFVTGPVPNIPEAGLGGRGIAPPPALPETDRRILPIARYSVAGAHAIWAEPIIPVCWEDLSGTREDGRKWTQEAVERTWEHVSNIDFTGWDQCLTDSSGIRLAVSDSGPNVFALGRQLDGRKNGMTLNFDFQNWGPDCAAHREFCIRALATHEFGHAIGLAHEHNRSDRTLCSEAPQGPLAAFIMTTYDANSVMNYCSESWNNNGHLSKLDVAGVRLLYGPFSEETPAIAQLGGSISLKKPDSDE